MQGKAEECYHSILNPVSTNASSGSHPHNTSNKTSPRTGVSQWCKRNFDSIALKVLGDQGEISCQATDLKMCFLSEVEGFTLFSLPKVTNVPSGRSSTIHRCRGRFCWTTSGEKGENSRLHHYDLDLPIHFNIVRAPWWGGMFERLVCPMKRCLRKVAGKARLSYKNSSPCPIANYVDC